MFNNKLQELKHFYYEGKMPIKMYVGVFGAFPLRNHKLNFGKNFGRFQDAKSYESKSKYESSIVSPYLLYIMASLIRIK